MEETQSYDHSRGLKRAGMMVALYVAGKATAYVSASPLFGIVNNFYPVTPEQVSTYVTGAVLMGLVYAHHYLKDKYPFIP